MARLDFPSSPTTGQQYPSPAVAGQPVYVWDGEKWTTSGGNVVSAIPGTLPPLADGPAPVVGVSGKYAREDHVHPTDTSRAAVNSPTLTGDPQAPTPSTNDNDNSIATTAFVQAAIAPWQRALALVMPS